MTDEIRVRANQLHSEIQNLEGRIETLKAINSSCKETQISSDEIGTVHVGAGLYESAIDFIIDMLNQRKEQLEDDYRML